MAAEVSFLLASSQPSILWLFNRVTADVPQTLTLYSIANFFSFLLRNSLACTGHGKDMEMERIESLALFFDQIYL